MARSASLGVPNYMIARRVLPYATWAGLIRRPTYTRAGGEEQSVQVSLDARCCAKNAPADLWPHMATCAHTSARVLHVRHVNTCRSF